MNDLTVGSIQRIFGGDKSIKPVLQVIDMKQVGSQSNNSRHRLVLSDGQYYAQSMLATQLNTIISSGQLQNHCIVKINDYVVNEIQSKTIVIVLDCEVKGAPTQKIGNPQNYQSSIAPASHAPSGGGMPPAASMPQNRPNPYQQGASNSYQQSASNPYQQSNSAPANGSNGFSANPYASAARGAPVQRNESNTAYQPIASLNPYQNRWTIKARVTKKNDIRRWSNAKGEGHLASIDLLDDQGTEIRATMFKEDCDRIYPKIEEGRIYSFSGGRLKVANKQYSSIKNDYEITFGRETNVEGPFSEENSNIEYNRFTFRQIVELQSVQPNSMVDLIAVVKEAGEVADIVSQKLGGKVLKKRDLTLVDQSNMEIRMTVWGDQAMAQNKWENFPVVACKGVKVSDYGGVSLSTLNSSQILVNPEVLKEFHDLRSWWNSHGSSASTTSLSTGGGGGRWATKIQNRATVSQLGSSNLGYGPKPDYAEVKATLTYMKHDPSPWYQSCPNDDCKKKVNQGFDGGFLCEKCNKTYPNCVHRYVMSTRFMDHTGQDWFSVFNEQGKEILGKSADELNELQVAGNDVGYEAAFAAANFTQYNIRVRIKAETYNDESRIKMSIMNLKPIDPVEESRMLIEAINMFPDN